MTIRPAARTRPILFSGPMVRAILSGAKTQTRRVITPQPDARLRWGFTGWEDGHGRALPCRYGAPGDLLWVRETWCAVDGCTAYRADDWIDAPSDDEKWHPSIFMPRAISRITLAITSVRVERVQDISEASAMDEGVERDTFGEHYRQAFIALWNAINAKRGYSWERNPWVWTLTFQQVTP